MEKLLEMGETLFSQGKLEEAQECFVQALKESPLSADLLNNIGVTYHAKGDIQHAIEYFLKALEIDSHHLDARINLADAYCELKEWNRASEHLEHSIAYNRTYQHRYELYNRLALVYLKSGRVKNAGEAFRKSLEVNPNQREVKETLDIVCQAAENSHTAKHGAYQAAFCEIDIASPVSKDHPAYLQSMPGPPRKATSVLAPLKVQILLLEDENFTKVLMVSADLFGVGPEIVEPVRHAARPWGIEPEGIIISASNTHYTPATIPHASKLFGSFYADYTEKITETIINHLAVLYKKLERCDLRVGCTHTRIGFNRSVHANGGTLFAPKSRDYYHEGAPFLFLDLKESKTRIVLLNHGCHPTGLEQCQRISSEYLGTIRQRLISTGVAHAVMFFQGAVGSTKQKTEADGTAVSSHTNEGVVKNGEALANSLVKTIKFETKKVSGPIFCLRRSVSIPLGLVSLQSASDGLVRERSASTKYGHVKIPERIDIEVQFMSLGKHVYFLAVPWERVAELGKDIISRSPNPQSTFILGYTKGLTKYLGTDDMLEEGGYKPRSFQLADFAVSSLGKGNTELIGRAVTNFFEELNKENIPNGYGRYHLTKNPKKAFFVLSAGSCGTVTLAGLLDTAINARVWHHPQPDPIRESLLAYWEEIDKKAVFWKSRFQIIHKSWSEGLIHGETDPFMTPFADAIAEEIPEAKFIVLVNDPKDFVCLGMQRNYYDGHPWDFGRLRPKEGTREFETWAKLDRFEKVCWLWKNTYEHILKFIATLPEHQVKIVRLEDLIRDTIHIKALFDFLELSGYKEGSVAKILSNRLNVQRTGKFPSPDDWPEGLVKKLHNYCYETALKLGYPMNKLSSSRYFKGNAKRRKCSPQSTSESLGYGSNCETTGLQYVRINSTTNKDLAGRLLEAKIFIAPGAKILCPEVIIGRCTRINGPITIKGINRCKIGKYCALGEEIRIITHNHLTNRPNLQVELQRRLGCNSILSIGTDVDIGCNVWIGDSVIILPGSSIGHGAVIGAGSVVTRPIPPFGIAVGTPAKVIKFRFSPNIIQQLLEISWWDWPEDRISRNKEFFDLDLTGVANIDLFSIIRE